jgi:hypothetical protein
VDDETELALRAELDETRERLRQAQRELFDSRARLALIARVCQDVARMQRAPGVFLGVIRTAVFGTPPNVRMVHRHLAGIDLAGPRQP